MQVRCRVCKEHHDLEALEPSFKRPDAFLDVPDDERPRRTFDSKDACAVRNADESNGRYFLRVLMPFTVIGLAAPYSRGVWVEVTLAEFDRAYELWDDPLQHREAAFPGRLANKMAGYEGCEMVVGLISLTDPDNIPNFVITGPPGHPLFVEQSSGITPERAFEWILPVYHPELDWIH